MKKLMELMAEELASAFEKAGYDPSDRIFANISAMEQWLVQKRIRKPRL